MRFIFLESPDVFPIFSKIDLASFEVFHFYAKEKAGRLSSEPPCQVSMADLFFGMGPSHKTRHEM
jgi:hypothetical protein